MYVGPYCRWRLPKAVCKQRLDNLVIVWLSILGPASCIQIMIYEKLAKGKETQYHVVLQHIPGRLACNTLFNHTKVCIYVHFLLVVQIRYRYTELSRHLCL